MAKEVALSYADLEREAAELIASFTAVEGRTSLSALTGLSARRDSEESRRGNSTPSSASSERVRSPDSDSAGQGAFFSPPVSANVDQRRLSMEQVLRLNAERIASEVRSRHNGGAGPAVQDSANRETKKVLKKLADKWSRYADSFGYCNRCGEEVLDAEQGCEALGKVYHSACFKCSTCGSTLVGQTFYSVKDTVYCEKDYLDMLDKCYKCQKPIQDKVVRALGEVFHPECFVCCVCWQPLDGVPFTVDARNELHCVTDFNKKYAPKCGTCGGTITPSNNAQENYRIVAMGRSFHPQCYRCEDCDKSLTQHGEGCYPLDNHLLCRDCNSERIQSMTSTLL